MTADRAAHRRSLNEASTSTPDRDLVIAIDGPAGSGKSTVASAVARHLGLRYLDTGAIYRALTWQVLRLDLPLSDTDAIAAAAAVLPLAVSTDPQRPSVHLDGRDITADVRGPAVTAAVSAVSAVPQVRRLLTRLQRELIGDGGIVVEGRDIGTVVVPDAEVKVFLTASRDVRAGRRSRDAETAPPAEHDIVTVGTVRDDLDRRDALDSTRAAAPLAQAADAVVIDSSAMDVNAVVERVLALAEAATGGPVGGSQQVVDVGGGTPVVAVVGRPNVGKSTLVNRLIGRREAVVEDVPGVTRDRVAYDAAWGGREFVLVDTGGWEPDALGLQAQVSTQAELAAASADVVVMVVDATVGVTQTDEVVARTLRRARRPVVLVANKVDTAQREADAAGLWSLGLGEPHPVSALHGRGSGDLLDLVVAALPPAPPATDHDESGPRRVALLGRPNVGKSSLLNKLSGEQRAVVDAVAGTTRDPVDSLVELAGTTWRFIDTAGIRRRVREASGAEYYASLRTATALREAEVAVVLLDASEQLAEQDLRIIEMVIEAGRALVLAFNKWDLLDEDRRERLDKEIDRQLQHVAWAPRVNVSARTGRGIDRLTPAIELALDGWGRRVATSRLNAWLGQLIAATPPPVRGGRQPKVLFATQAGTEPPRFVLFSSGFLEAPYRRFLERRLREDFGFPGTPVEVSVRVKEARKGGPRGGGKARTGRR